MKYTDEQIRAMVDADFDSMFHGAVAPTLEDYEYAREQLEKSEKTEAHGD